MNFKFNLSLCLLLEFQLKIDGKKNKEINITKSILLDFYSKQIEKGHINALNSLFYC